MTSTISTFNRATDPQPGLSHGKVTDIAFEGDACLLTVCDAQTDIHEIFVAWEPDTAIKIGDGIRFRVLEDSYTDEFGDDYTCIDRHIEHLGQMLKLRP